MSPLYCAAVYKAGQAEQSAHVNTVNLSPEIRALVGEEGGGGDGVLEIAEEEEGEDGGGGGAGAGTPDMVGKGLRKRWPESRSVAQKMP